MSVKGLALETSSRYGSVALAEEGRGMARGELSQQQRHTAELIPTLERLCREAAWRTGDLNAVYFSVGPGSFTGLRVAATAARMLKWSAACEVVAVPTLEVIAANVVEAADARPNVAVLLDAMRGQVYSASFAISESGKLEMRDPAGLRDPAAWLAGMPRPFCIVGEGVRYHEEVCNASGGRIMPEVLAWPRAEVVAEIGFRLLQQGRTCAAHEILPLYIRRPEAEEVYEQRRSEARARRGE